MPVMKKLCQTVSSLAGVLDLILLKHTSSLGLCLLLLLFVPRLGLSLCLLHALVGGQLVCRDGPVLLQQRLSHPVLRATVVVGRPQDHPLKGRVVLVDVLLVVVVVVVV